MSDERMSRRREVATYLRPHFKKRRISNLELDKEDLHGLEMQGTDIWESSLRGANLACVRARGVRWMIVDLTGADLSGADLRDASLSNVAFDQADLSGADLRGAFCMRVHGRLDEAAMVTFEGANLDGANLWGVAGLPREVRERFVERLRQSWEDADRRAFHR